MYDKQRLSKETMNILDKQPWESFELLSILILALTLSILELECTSHISDHVNSCDNISRHLNPIKKQIWKEMTITFWCFNNFLEMGLHRSNVLETLW